jgi:sensor histidine kinase regulating citrate/malate metabolism
MIILISITGVTPVQYHKLISNASSSPETLIWLFIMLLMFILIDRKNNRTTEAMTLNEELVKKQTVEHISETFDAQRQKLQIMELSWSDNTVEFLRSARHDLINHLEKSKTGLDELLIEVYDNVVKPYSSSILESQKEMRSYVEEITCGRLSEYSLSSVGAEIAGIIGRLSAKTSSYMGVYFENSCDVSGKYCKMNRLFFTAVNNIIDNSVYALQRLVLNGDFKARLRASIALSDGKTFCIKISDNAGGLSKENIAKIYKFQIESSKGQRLGEGTIIAGNFIKLLGGYVTAQNIRRDGSSGLETSVYLPYYEKRDDDRIKSADAGAAER